jgi:hypothetical protein
MIGIESNLVVNKLSRRSTVKDVFDSYNLEYEDILKYSANKNNFEGLDSKLLKFSITIDNICTADISAYFDKDIFYNTNYDTSPKYIPNNNAKLTYIQIQLKFTDNNAVKMQKYISDIINTEFSKLSSYYNCDYESYGRFICSYNNNVVAEIQPNGILIYDFKSAEVYINSNRTFNADNISKPILSDISHKSNIANEYTTFDTNETPYKITHKNVTKDGILNGSMIPVFIDNKYDFVFSNPIDSSYTLNNICRDYQLVKTIKIPNSENYIIWYASSECGNVTVDYLGRYILLLITDDKNMYISNVKSISRDKIDINDNIIKISDSFYKNIVSEIAISNNMLMQNKHTACSDSNINNIITDVINNTKDRISNFKVYNGRLPNNNELRLPPNPCNVSIKIRQKDLSVYDIIATSKNRGYTYLTDSKHADIYKIKSTDRSTIKIKSTGKYIKDILPSGINKIYDTMVKELKKYADKSSFSSNLNFMPHIKRNNINVYGSFVDFYKPENYVISYTEIKNNIKYNYTLSLPASAGHTPITFANFNTFKSRLDSSFNSFKKCYDMFSKSDILYSHLSDINKFNERNFDQYCSTELARGSNYFTVNGYDISKEYLANLHFKNISSFKAHFYITISAQSAAEKIN